MKDYERDIEHLLALLCEAGKKAPDVTYYPTDEPTFGDGATEADLNAFEAMLPAPLPIDFQYFQTICGSISAPHIWNGYFLHEIMLVQRIMFDYESYPKNFFLDINRLRMLPIGSDGGGNLFLMSIGPANYITKWNHEVNEQSRLANNFTEFLQRMVEDWEHFIVEDSGWHYMSG